MKAFLKFRNFFIVLLTTGFLTITSNLPAQEKVPEPKEFKIIVEKTKSGFKLQSVSGSAWTNLAFKIPDDRPQAIDEYGMTAIDKTSSKKDTKLADYLFTITKSGKNIILKSNWGAAWTELWFSLSENEKQAVDQFGMATLD